MGFSHDFRNLSSRPRLSRGRWFSTATFAVVVLMILVAPVGANIFHQIGLDDASPANGHAAVIAQGVAPMPEGDLVWRVVADSASTDNEETADARALGFLLAGGDSIAINDADLVPQMYLSTGETTFVAAGSQSQTVGLAFDPVPFYRLELVAADDAEASTGENSYSRHPRFPRQKVLAISTWCAMSSPRGKKPP